MSLGHVAASGDGRSILVFDGLALFAYVGILVAESCAKTQDRSRLTIDNAINIRIGVCRRALVTRQLAA